MPSPAPDVAAPDVAAPDVAAYGDAGFTLLEVLVAFVIAALALGVLFEGAVEGIRSARIADRTEVALSRAQSHLATVGHGVPLATTTQEGADGSDYRWRLRIVPLQSASMAGAQKSGAGGAGGDEASADQAPRVVLYGVQVTESWPDPGAGADGTRSVTLRTERLGAPAGGGP